MKNNVKCFAKVPAVKELKLNEDKGIAQIEYICALTGKKCCPLYCPLKHMNPFTNSKPIRRSKKNKIRKKITK